MAAQTKVSTETETTWWTYPRWVRRGFTGYAVAVVLFAAYVVLKGDGLTGLNWITIGLQLAVAMCFASMVRMRTSVNAESLTVVEFKKRVVKWNDIEAVTNDGGGRWATKVEAQVRHGKPVVLTHVPPNELADVLKWDPRDEPPDGARRQ